ncbi:Probable ATP-dependent DNA helicase CHR12 [Linum perenne]
MIPIPAMASQLDHPQQPTPDLDPSPDNVHQTKSLISALNFVSRNLPLPPDVFQTVSSIYLAGPDEDNTLVADDIVAQEDPEISSKGDLMAEFEDALSNQKSKFMSSSVLAESRVKRYQSTVEHRVNELEELPSTRGEDVQAKCLLELYGLKLGELQRKVRSEVNSEYMLRLSCACPEKQLFDWSMMRLRRPLYGVGDAFATEADDQFRKKRDAEQRLSRLEEQERNNFETRKRKFFAEVLNALREFQLQNQASLKRRKQRNDGIQAWHGRQRQRATRAEKLRFQALKADDQEAYMRLVKESKNERLTMLLSETNKLLVNLGAAVQRQKDTADGIEPLPDSEADSIEVDASRNESPGSTPEDADSDNDGDTADLLEGQRQYNSAIHSIEEKVTEQPSILKGGQLRPYQVEGLQWMISLFNNNLNGILADEMGLGKTIQTISLIAYLKEKKGIAGPHIIMAPKAVLPNWINEFATWVPEHEIKAVHYDGRADERKAMRENLLREGSFDVLITHYDLLMKDKAFLKKINWVYLIVDEGHRLKNHECALSRTLESGFQFQRRLLLTGTPIQNSLQELWSLLNFLLPSIFNSAAKFEEWFNLPFADRGDISLTEEEQLLVIRRLHHVIRPFILRRKKDEVEKFLPSKSQVILKCDMSSWQKVYYQQITEMGRVGLQNGSGKSKSLQNLTMQLRKCCNHPYLFVGDDYNMRQIDEITRASGKFEMLDRLLPKLRATGHRILLFSQMTKLMNILEIYLRLHGYMYLRLDGTTKTEERGAKLKQFNAPNSPYFMFLLSTRAGGLGLNLQTADTVIMFDSDWNPQMDQQAEDRAHRIGQKKEVRVFVLVSVGSIEEVILERAKQKMGIDAKVIQAGLFNTTSTAQDRRELLEEIMRKGTSSLGTDVPSEREINRLAARSPEEFQYFEKLDEERRRKENYRSRLMEEHEVPEWAYQNISKDDKASKGFDHTAVLGKRKRKDVSYADTLTDRQFSKAVENGDYLSTLSGRRSETPPHRPANQLVSNGASPARMKAAESMNESMATMSEGTSEEMYMSAPRRMKLADDDCGMDKYELQSSSSSSRVVNRSSSMWSTQMLTWNTHKKKRSNYAAPTSSSDSRGQNSSGRGNRWT